MNTEPRPDEPAVIETPPTPEEASPLPYMSDAYPAALFSALSLAQGELGSALKSSTNPHYKSSYADLDSVWAAIRSPLSKNGLCVVQSMQPSPGGTRLVSILGHTSGQWIRSEVPVKPEQNKIHAIGSAITYMRRYALMALVGVSPADDDGNEATKR